MSIVAQAVRSVSRQAHAARAAVFQRHFPWIGPKTRILDLGAAEGDQIHSMLRGLNVLPGNIYAADINPVSLGVNRQRYGYSSVLLKESEPLPFEGEEFDIVVCSSVIEHVTVPKSEMWNLRSGSEFKRRSWPNQIAFANEIRRVGKHHFVQTPAAYFPIESHTWLPFFGYLPRRAQIPLMHIANRLWIKDSFPDWNLLSSRQMQRLFPDSTIVREWKFGFVKSLMAIR